MVGTRDLTPDFITEIEATQLRMAFFVKFEFDSGTSRIWSGYGTKIFLGETYIGLGSLGSISAVEESQELRANNVTFKLSGIPTANISAALSEDYQGRPVTLWLATLDEDYAVIDDPLELFSGIMDVMEIQESRETASLTVRCESDLIILQKSKLRRYTPEDQKIDFPDDKGLDFVASIQDAELLWGSG